MPYKTYPFIGPPQQRGTGTGDQRYINCLFERIPNDILREHVVYCVKRPGLTVSTTPASSTTGRGIYAWGATGKIYSVFNNKIYSGTTDLGMTLAASTGRVWFTERPVSTGAQNLILSDGTDNYNITTGDVATQIDETDDADYPTSNLGPIIYMDGYLFQAKSNGQLWNSDLNSAVAWTATSYLSVDAHGGALEAVLQQKDQIIALTKNRVETLFNNGNPVGSPLLRIDQNIIYVGIASKNSLAWSGEEAIFVSENGSENGGRGIFMIASGKMREISTPVEARFMDAEGSSITSCTSWMGSVSGQVVYCLNLSSANRSFVYSTETGLWSEWTAQAGGKFNCVSATSLNGTTYLQDATTGQIYTILPTVFQDKSANFTVTLQTQKQNNGSNNRKFEHKLSIIGDITTGVLGVATSDDDFANFLTQSNINMASPNKSIYRLGSYYDRSHRFTYTDNYAFRVQAYAPSFSVGSS